MTNRRLQRRIYATAGLVVLWAGMPAAGADAQTCEAAKLKLAGKYSFCELKAEAKAVKAGNPVDFSKCDAKFTNKWESAEAAGGISCPTTGDAAQMQNKITADTSSIALALAGPRFVDNGDGTVSDTQTGLMWEKKDNLGGGANLSDPHDADNTYSWSASGTSPNGTVFTNFLGSLNNGMSTDGTTITGCFDDHCDWRLPTGAELKGIVDMAAPGCGSGSPCINPVFGPTVASTYWFAASFPANPSIGWGVNFFDGISDGNDKIFFPGYVRAVRGGL